MKEFIKDFFSFSSTLHIVRLVCVAVILVIVILEIVRLCVDLVRKKKDGDGAETDEVMAENSEEKPDDTNAEEPAEAQPQPAVVEEPSEQSTFEEVKEEPAKIDPQPVVVVEPVPIVIVEEVKPVPVAEPIVEEKDEIVITDLSDDLETAKRVPFKNKILASEEKIQGYYTEIENAFRAYRKVNSRLSIKSLSFRLGRELIAKMTIRGRTLKLHLALEVKDFDQSVYFQKDMSDVKEYVEVPFAVKIRSDRALKNALVLIEALAEKHGIEKKARFTRVDSIAALKDEEELSDTVKE